MLSFAGMAVLVQTKLVVGGDPAEASALQALFVVSWYFKPLYGFAVDQLENFGRRPNTVHKEKTERSNSKKSQADEDSAELGKGAERKVKKAKSEDWDRQKSSTESSTKGSDRSQKTRQKQTAKLAHTEANSRFEPSSGSSGQTGKFGNNSRGKGRGSDQQHVKEASKKSNSSKKEVKPEQVPERKVNKTFWRCCLRVITWCYISAVVSSAASGWLVYLSLSLENETTERSHNAIQNQDILEHRSESTFVGDQNTSSETGVDQVRDGIQSNQSNAGDDMQAIASSSSIFSNSSLNPLKPSKSAFYTAYVVASVLNSLGTAIQDVVMDGVQVRWVQLVDSQNRVGAGGGVQSATWRGRFLSSAVAGVVGALCNEYIGAAFVHALQMVVHGVVLPVLLLAIQLSPDYQQLCYLRDDSNLSKSESESESESDLSAKSCHRGSQVIKARWHSQGERQVPSDKIDVDDSELESESDHGNDKPWERTAQVDSSGMLSWSESVDLDNEGSYEGYNSWSDSSESSARAEYLSKVGEEESEYSSQQSSRQRNRVYFCRTLAFMFFFHVSPSVGGVWSYYLLEELQLWQSTLSVVGAVGGVSLAIGAGLFSRPCCVGKNAHGSRCAGSETSRWTILCIVSIVSFVMGFDVLLILNRTGQGVLGFDWGSQWCVGAALSVPAAIGGVMGGYATIPVQHAAAESCLVGKETMSFAVLMSVHNVAGGLSSLWGAGMAREFGVKAGSYGNMAALTVSCNTLGLLFCACIPLLPLAKQHTRTATVGGGGSTGYALAAVEDDYLDDETDHLCQAKTLQRSKHSSKWAEEGLSSDNEHDIASEHSDMASLISAGKS